MKHGCSSRLRLLAALVAALPAACASGPPRPTAVDAERLTARWPDLGLADLEHGRELYVGRCSSCHVLYEPASFGSERWEVELRKMRDRARLDDDQELRILQYLVSVSGRAESASTTSPIKSQ